MGDIKREKKVICARNVSRRGLESERKIVIVLSQAGRKLEPAHSRNGGKGGKRGGTITHGASCRFGKG